MSPRLRGARGWACVADDAAADDDRQDRYQFERTFVSDAAKFQGAFGPFEPTPHPEAVTRTVDWFRRQYAG